jgi:hypothetical protein
MTAKMSYAARALRHGGPPWANARSRTTGARTSAWSEQIGYAKAVIVGSMLCVSVRSTSVNAMVPLSIRLPTGVTSSVTAPVTSVTATTGTSLVPVIVTRLLCL